MVAINRTLLQQRQDSWHRFHSRRRQLAVCAVAVAALATACVPDPADQQQKGQEMHTTTGSDNGGTARDDSEDRFADERRRMVQTQMAARDITNERVLDALRRVPRHRFVPEHLQDSAHTDRPLPIGEKQTISQPYIVALMTQLAQPKPDSIALDVGTGSGYQAAVLGELCKHVYSIEIVESLARDAAQRLDALGYDNVTVRAGDGYRGWPEHAPFDVIIVAAAPDHIPSALVEQLAPGGRLIVPVGSYYQELTVVEKQPDGTTRQWSVAPVAFVPMTGEAQRN
jgi:protein-L-isoaspartate(D-aspartate) O-methyltransferase